MPHSTESTEPRWNALLRITRSWRLEWGLDTLLGRVAREAVEFLELSRGIVYILTPEGLSVQSVWPGVGHGADFKAAAAQSREIAEKVVHTGRPVFAHVLGKSRRRAATATAGSHSVFCVPLTANRGILGALYVDSHETLKGLNQQDLEFLEMLGLQAAAALEHALLHQSAITDPLTRLYTHRQFQQETEQAVRRAVRSGQPVSLLILDLDHFKELNDSCGHEAGNACLLRVAQTLRESVRATDVIARFGGDEFEILLPDTRARDAVTVAEKIRRAIEALRFEGKRRVTATLGIAGWPENAADAQTLFLRADEALYQAKESGRNRTVRSKLAAQKLPPLQRRDKAPAPLSALERITPLHNQDAVPISSSSLKAVRTETIDGHALVRRLGMGSMGEVLLVRQPELEREVALKRPLTGHLTPAQVSAFEREAKVTASLNHPGVITVLTMGRDSDGRRYYTMKPLQGSSLRKVLEQRKKNGLSLRGFSLSRLLEILQRVSETIAYAHQRGVVHLDLTPDNIIVGDFGEVSIIDWGSGTSSSSTTRRGAQPKSNLAFLTGSVGSIAPEQLPGSRLRPGAPADIHALGSILYEILTGRAAFRRENTHLTLQAVVKGTIEPPDTVAPRAGIDPLLSALCMHALHPNAKDRPSAVEFSEKLGRFVRRETEFVVTRFARGTKLDPRDWKIVAGSWRLKQDEWISGPEQNQIVLWKQPVAGDFRFVAEAWIETRGEIALTCKQRLANLVLQQGYTFQFGAEWSSCTKLLGLGVIGKLVPEPRVRYRLELEYIDGWLTCLLDGKKLFEHRELFHRSGDHIGFYTCDAGVHFRPIEVHRQALGLSVSTMRMADEFFALNQIPKALELYTELAERVPNRLEGLEALLKTGICFTRLKRIPAAWKAFRSLHKTKLEPYALAEEAQLDFHHAPRRNYTRGIAAYRRLLHDFFDSEAKWRVIEGTYCTFSEAKSERERQQHIVAIQSLGRESSSYPIMDQVRSGSAVLLALMNLGRWKHALDDGLRFEKRLPFQQRHLLGFDNFRVGTVLAMGRDELLPRDPFDNSSWGSDWLLFNHAWGSGSAVHIAVRRNKLKSLLRALGRGKVPKRSDAVGDFPYIVGTHVFAHLAAGDLAGARRTFNRYFDGRPAPSITAYYFLCAAACESMDDEIFHSVMDHRRHLPANVDSTNVDLVRGGEVRWYFEHRDFDRAAQLLSSPLREQHGVYQMKDCLVMQFLLASLGVLKSPGLDFLRGIRKQRLCGTLLDLAEMALELKAPVPGPLWPHPGFHPEWRLWLGLWLEAKGRTREARRVVLPARDPRYGLMHSQPGIEALLKRTAGAARR